MKYKIIPATNGPKHHLFGFHDLVAFNQTGEKLLSLEADVINRPPLPGEQFGVGYVLWEKQEFVRLGETCALNYPQGARQQWIDNTHFIVNNRVGDHWGADIYNVESGKKVKTIDSTCHILRADKKKCFGINYARLHRLGGYGYIGIDDPYCNEETPEKDGIYVTDIKNNTTKLLVSIQDISECDATTSAHNGFHHYVTHLVLSPNGKRIAFLHRFFLSDGGLRTRLMTIGVDGKDLRCLAVGFLSHFDWRNDNSIFIWGRAGGNIDAMRSNPLFSNPLIKPFMGVAKSLARKVLKRSKGMSMSFLMCMDKDIKDIKPFALGIITEDGHPMCCPTDRNIAICDNYPDKLTHCRTLFFYDFEKNERTNLGTFRMSDEQPVTDNFIQFSQGVDLEIMKLFSPALFSFTRSGLHCDLHPRWDANGKMVAFDSIHEGTRQIYICKK